MKKHRIIAILLAVVLSVSSGFPPYGAEASAAEIVEPGMTSEEEPAAADAEESGTTAGEESGEAAEEESGTTSEEEFEEADAEAPAETDGEEPGTADSAAPEEGTGAGPEAESGEGTADTSAEEAGDTAEKEPAEAAAEEDAHGTAGGDGESAAEGPEEGAEENGDETVLIAEEAEEQAYEPNDTKPSDELFAGYVDAEFGIGTGKPGALKRRASAGSRLESDTLAAYTYVSSLLPSIASGEISSTRFTLPAEVMTYTQIAWTAEDLGVAEIVKSNAITAEAKEAASSRFREEYFDLSLLIDALLADHPYLLYWYDKTPKTTADGYKYRAFKVDGIWYLGYSGTMRLNFPVAEEYAAGEYTVDASVGQTVQRAVENAQEIIGEFESLFDYEKLVAYRQRICELTSYNYDAIENSAPYGNPWQLIWVFDGDSGTKVVCEGYAKAFKYLCDRSSFVNGIECRIVTGRINDGGHMWNIVMMEDGWNYLTDVTNCDTGTAGAADKLFMVGAPGSPEEGYTVDLGSYSMRYTYDQDMLALWSAEELTLSPYNYPPFIENAVVSGIGDKTYSGGEITQEITVLYGDRILTEGTDYTVSYENNIDAGTARMLIEGKGCYHGTIEREFEIEKAPQPLQAETDKILNGRNGNVKITGAAGTLTAALPETSSAQVISVDQAGTIRIKGMSTGTAILTVTAAETENYLETTIETQISVVPLATTHVGLTNVASGIKVYWEAVEGARYYKVYRGTEFLFTTSRLYATDTGAKSENGNKYTYKVVASTTKESGIGDSTVTRTGTGYRLIPVGITLLTNPAAGKMAVGYGQNDKSTGYVIRFGLKQDMSDAKVITVQGAGTLQRVLSGVIKGKTYYVQVRTYKLENGARYYSGYCTTKSLRITR